MPLLDVVKSTVLGLAKQKLSGVTSRGVDIGTIIGQRSTQKPRPGNFPGNQERAYPPPYGGPRAAKQTPGSRDPFSAASARSDPLMNFNWWADLPNLDGNQFKIGWEFIEEVTLPFIEFEQVSNYRAGKQYHFAHHYNIGTLNVKFYEDSYGTSTQYLTHWQSIIQSQSSGLYRLPKDYKKTISIWVLDVSKLTVMCLVYTGCWPTRLDTMQLGSASSDRVVVGAEFSVDEMHVDFIKVNPSNIPANVGTIGSEWPLRMETLETAFAEQADRFSFLDV